MFLNPEVTRTGTPDRDLADTCSWQTSHAIGDHISLSTIRDLNKTGNQDLKDGFSITDTVSNLYKGIKDWISPPTLDEMLREKAFAGLTPQEQSAYRKEGWQTGILPTDIPMHHKVQDEADQMRKKYEDQILSQMGPNERREYEREKAAYDAQQRKIDDYYLNNPLGDGFCAPRPIKPGPMLQYVQQQIEVLAKRE